MRISSLLSLMIMTSMLVSCGAKNESGSASNTVSNTSTNPFTTDPYRVRTVNGYINVDTLLISFGTPNSCTVQPCEYRASPQTENVVRDALDISFRQNIQPDSYRMLKAKITGAVSTVGVSPTLPRPGYQDMPTPQLSTFDIQSMVIYR